MLAWSRAGRLSAVTVSSAPICLPMADGSFIGYPLKSRSKNPARELAHIAWTMSKGKSAFFSRRFLAKGEQELLPPPPDC